MAKSICSTADCGRDVYAKGLCKPCYNRARKERREAETPRPPCACGCGQPAPINADGEIRRFLSGHNARGVPSKQRVPFEIQFVKFVQLGGPDECWPWTGGSNSGGYGVVSRNGKSAIATRETYKLFNGPIPPGKVIRHTCDNPPCCNPAHLIDGSHWDNIQDAIERGRFDSVGEANPKACLTSPEVTEIRNAFSNGTTIDTLADRYNVSDCTIRDIVKWRTWKHVD